MAGEAADYTALVEAGAAPCDHHWNFAHGPMGRPEFEWCRKCGTLRAWFYDNQGGKQAVMMVTDSRRPLAERRG